MANLQKRIDVTSEIRTCEHIWSLDDTAIDAELRKAGLDPDALCLRLNDGIAPIKMAARAIDAQPQQHLAPSPGGHSLGSSAGEPRSAPIPTPRPPMPVAAPGGATFELAGKIKFFDAAKGYGFFVADGDRGDVLVHVTHLNAAGYHAAYEGARIHALVQKTEKGLQVVQIISIDETSAIHPSQIPPRTREKVNPESSWVRALVKWYNTTHGYGFVHERQGIPDCFVHADVLRRWGMPPLRPGQVVEIRWGTGSKGRMVAEIRHPDAASGLPPVH
jgi:CspA family cold shock protein